MLDKSFIYKDLNKIPNEFQDCVAILGNFDCSPRTSNAY